MRKNKLTKLLCTVLALVMLLTAAPITGVDMSTFLPAAQAEDNPQYQYMNIDAGGVVKKYSGEFTDVVIPAVLPADTSVKITEIGDYAFYGNKFMKTVTIPASIEKIGRGGL